MQSGGHGFTKAQLVAQDTPREALQDDRVSELPVLRKGESFICQPPPASCVLSIKVGSTLYFYLIT